MWKPWGHTSYYGGEEKTEDYNFFEISSFFRFDKHQRALGVLSEQTCADLGFEDLFMFSDRTVSRVGQQYLYNLMRTISAGAKGVPSFSQGRICRVRPPLYVLWVSIYWLLKRFIRPLPGV